MRRVFAYADPPYPGCASYYAADPNANEVNHEILIGTLELHYPDGWALSTSVSGLAECLPLIRVPYHVGAWAKTNPKPYRGQRWLRAWEPVIFGGIDSKGKPSVRDWVASSMPRRVNGEGLLGAKPPEFCRWLLLMLGATPLDEVRDLFPGSGSLGRSRKQQAAQPELLP